MQIVRSKITNGRYLTITRNNVAITLFLLGNRLP